MPAKRAHKKSRNGCGVCRARRVKCDEVKPECGPCRKHEVRCNYDRQTFTPQRATSDVGSPSPTTPKSRRALWTSSSFKPAFAPPAFGFPYSTARMADLQLMNHYTYMHVAGAQSATTDPRVRQMWTYDVPQRAVGCEFLMQAILSFAALHLHIYTPNDTKMRDLSHHYFGTALRMFTQSLSTLDSHNADMAFAASVLIQFQVFMNWKDPCGDSSADYEPPVTWLEMCQGVASLLKSGLRSMQYSCMRPLIETGPHLLSTGGGIYPLSHTQAAAAVEEYAPPFEAMAEFLQADSSQEKPILDETFRLIHSLYEFHITGDCKAWTRRRLLTFPIAVKGGFVELLRLSDPRALVIMAYYFAVMKMVDDIWWFQGRPEHEINGIYSLLPHEWRDKFMDWPLEMISGSAAMSGLSLIDNEDSSNLTEPESPED